MINFLPKFMRPRGYSKVLGYKRLECGVDVIEYQGKLADVQEEIRGLAASFIIQDEWEAYKFTEEVFQEVKKIQEQRLRAEDLMRDVNFKLAPMEWTNDYQAEEAFTDVLIKYGTPC